MSSGLDAQVDAVMRASRVLVAVAARSVAEIEHQVSLSQLRILVMVATRGPLNLSSVAEALDVHPSNATRACDRLVTLGLLHRAESPTDRRHLSLTPTPEGAALVESVMQRRRQAIEAVVRHIPAEHRRGLAPALEAFATAAGEFTDEEAHLGWTL